MVSTFWEFWLALAPILLALSANWSLFKLSSFDVLKSLLVLTFDPASFIFPWLFGRFDLNKKESNIFE